MYQFEWDPAKAAVNARKHQVTFELACEVFWDPYSISIPDDEHSQFEERWITMGFTRSGRLLVVCHTHLSTGAAAGSIRIISARPATPSERRQYEAGR